MFGALTVASPLAAEETSDRSSAKAPEAASSRPGSPALYRALAENEARRAGMPGEIADAVMAVESGYDPGAIGSVGEIGLMQVLPSTARALGFEGRMEGLAVPETNIRYGVKYLAGAWRLAGGDLCTAVMKYRAGHGETRFSHRSVDYCLAVRAKLMARGYPVAGIVPIATFGDVTPSRLRSALVAGCRRNCLAASGRAELDFDAINTRLDHIVIQANANAVRLR
ncbi:transglycosylase SLT domain-containing protein [Methylosinus sp. H3A]|nr:transglycosylase SLT domain-containing protein [Methylosinus sp. H3A]